jgi:hypothetical protein
MRFTFAEQEETEPELSEAQKRKLLVWKEYTSSSGQPFWYNKFTKETSWRDPLSVECDDLQWRTMQALETAARTNATILLQDLPDGWVQRQSRSKGFVYFQDIFTGQRSWDQPKRQLLCEVYLPVHLMYTSIYTPCTPPCTPHVHLMYTSLYASCTPHVHLMYTSCTPRVHLMYTSCTPPCTPRVHLPVHLMYI